MEENIIDILFSSVNLPLTVFTILMVTLWIISMVSGMSGDLDIDVDVDVDADIDVDTDTDISGIDINDTTNIQLDPKQVIAKKQSNLKLWQRFLIYFNFVGIPFLFTFTVFIFVWWLSSVALTIQTQSYNNSFGYILVLILLIPCLFLTKIITNPLKGFFKKLNKDGDKAIEFIGKSGKSLSTIKGDKMGNAEILVEGKTINLYIKSIDKSEIKYNDHIVIKKQSKDKSHFYAQKIND